MCDKRKLRDINWHQENENVGGGSDEWETETVKEFVSRFNEQREIWFVCSLIICVILSCVSRVADAQRRLNTKAYYNFECFVTNFLLRTVCHFPWRLISFSLDFNDHFYVFCVKLIENKRRGIQGVWKKVVCRRNSVIIYSSFSLNSLKVCFKCLTFTNRSQQKFLILK